MAALRIHSACMLPTRQQARSLPARTLVPASLPRIAGAVALRRPQQQQHRQGLVTRAGIPEAAVAQADEEEGFGDLLVTTEDGSGQPFPAEIALDPQTKALASIPLALFYPLVLAAAAGAGFLGSVIGRGAPVSRQTKPITTAVVAAIGAGAVVYAGSQAKKQRDGAAVIELYNQLVDMEDPSTLTEDTVKAVGAKFGINMQRETEGMRRIMGQYLENIVPKAEQQLRGDEPDKISAFKDALSLSDEDLAAVFIETGRRLSRGAIEYKDRQAQFEQRKAFQRLIYLSYIVFGDQKAAFLLPWRRVFNLNDAQLFVARRENARAIFVAHLQERTGGDLPAERPVLRELRDYQLSVKMMDESAVEVVREASRRHVEKRLQTAIDGMRAPAKSRDIAAVLEEVRSVLDYARKLAKYANDDDLLPGLGMPSVHGGSLDAETKRRDIRDLFKLYVEESVAQEGAITPSLEADMKDLQVILCMGAKEAASIRDEVASRIYRNLLKEEVTSRRIDAATSPAAVLQSLCERTGFSPESAFNLHKQLFRQRVEQLLAKKRLSDEDDADIKRIRRILCITDDAANRIMKSTAGRALDEVIQDIYMMGAKPLSDSDGQRVDNLIQDLRMDRGVAADVLADATRAKFKSLVQAAQKELQRDRKAAAQMMRRLVQFNALTVTPLLERVKGTKAAAEAAEKAKKELAEIMVKAQEAAKKEEEAAKKAAGGEGSAAEAEAAAAEAKATAEAVETAKEVAEKAEAAAAASAAPEDPVQSVQKMIAASRGEFGEEERKGQKDITLVNDVDKPTRAELYKTYLMFSMSGDVVELPVGGVVRKKANLGARQAEMVRLQQLGDLLGMNQFEVGQVHQDLAEQAYKAQAQELMRGSGGLSEEQKKYLGEMRTQLGLPQEAADRIVKEVRTEVLGASAALEDGQAWTTDRVMQLSREGVDVTKMLEEPQRRALFRREVEKRVSDGKGDFDASFMFGELAKVLGIEERRIRMVVKELVGSRRRMTLVQAVSQLRQKRPSDAVTSLNNLLSAVRASPEEGPVQWNERSELNDLFGVYCAKVSDEAKQAELAKLFGISETEQQEIRATSGKTLDDLKKQQDDEDSFFG